MLSKDRLKEMKLFKELSDNEIEKVASILDEAIYKKGANVWEEGAAEQGLQIIDYGKIRISRNTNEGHRQVLAVLKANHFFGELSLLDGRSHSATAEALEDTKVYILQRSKMEALLKESPPTAYNILRVMTIEICELLRQMNAKFMDMVNYVWESRD
jgi:CRP/FNR family transcriptional regulator